MPNKVIYPNTVNHTYGLCLNTPMATSLSIRTQLYFLNETESVFRPKSRSIDGYHKALPFNGATGHCCKYRYEKTPKHIHKCKLGKKTGEWVKKRVTGGG